VPNIEIEGHFIRKLLSRHADTADLLHYQATKAVDKNVKVTNTANTGTCDGAAYAIIILSRNEAQYVAIHCAL